MGGWLGAPRTVRPTVKDPTHFDWLARVQVGGERMGAIARDAHQTREAVSWACRTLAAWIGLTLRTEPRGRPHNTARQRPGHRG